MRIIILSLLLTGCANSSYSAGDFAMTFLQAKAASSSTRDAVARGYSSQYANPTTVYQQEQFMNRAQNMYMYGDLTQGTGANQ
jgi:hypothetical protein